MKQLDLTRAVKKTKAKIVMQDNQQSDQISNDYIGQVWQDLLIDLSDQQKEIDFPHCLVALIGAIFSFLKENVGDDYVQILIEEITEMQRDWKSREAH